ncbi:MAG: LacI family transcriptional regulator [Sphingobacteriales bacterium]|nr:LacI family transcriptional regulator [Sphingobacteriales bacterium]
MGISVSYISKALNGHPAVSERVKNAVRKLAEERNYKHNSQAVNLRRGSARTIGVIVPQIDKSFFSEAIAGIEEVCSENGFSLIICQSHDSYEKECEAVSTLIHQNVDCVIISISAGTHSPDHLRNLQANGIEVIQFDRYIDELDSFKVISNDEEVSGDVVKDFIRKGYNRIAFIGGPEHLTIFRLRKKGYLKTLKEAGLPILKRFVFDDSLSKEQASAIAANLLTLENPPDAFFTVSDEQALGVLQAARALGVRVPEDLGIVGFANESFTGIVSPTLSSVDQKSKEMGKRAANLYFESMTVKQRGGPVSVKKDIIKAKIISRESSRRDADKPGSL